MSDDRYTDVYIGPEAGAGISDRRIPGEELRGGNPVGRCNCVAAGIWWDEVECVAVVHHERLSGLGCGDAVA